MLCYLCSRLFKTALASMTFISKQNMTRVPHRLVLETASVTSPLLFIRLVLLAEWPLAATPQQLYQRVNHVMRCQRLFAKRLGP
jgi:hypothetical protein